VATLYVENVPDEIYKAPPQAGPHQSQVLKPNIPTAEELKRRREFYDRMAELRARRPLSPGSWPSTEEMIREHREP
jgi:hypothetical protein